MLIDWTTKPSSIDEWKTAFGVDRILFLDAETFFIDENKPKGMRRKYSLAGHTYTEYVDHDLFKTHMVGWGWDNEDIDVTSVDELIAEVQELQRDGVKILLVCHNTRFDGTVLAWRYGLTFHRYCCTQDLAKLDNIGVSSSLKAQAIYNFPEDESMRKGEELVNADGVYQLDDDQYDELAGYCKQDVELHRAIFWSQLERLAIRIHSFNVELNIIHITLRGFIEPQFEIEHEKLETCIEIKQTKNREVLQDAFQFLEDAWGAENVKAVIAHCGGDKTKIFTSNDRFILLLGAMKIPVPVKLDKTTYEMKPALGKSDADYVRTMIKHSYAAPIWRARRLLNSNIEATRAQRMIDYSNIHQKFIGAPKPVLPMFLKYYGAENTGRWSGAEKLNQQNLSSGRGEDQTNLHRLSMKGLDGQYITVMDLSNIELRVNLWLCMQDDILNQIREGAVDADGEKYDYYCDVASPIFGFKVSKSKHKKERQMGKAAGLGLGFAMSAFGYQEYLATGPMGMDPIFIDDAESYKIKNAYDTKHYMIKAMWDLIQRQVLPVMAEGGTFAFGVNDCVIAKKDMLILPSGRVLRYPNCRTEVTETRDGFRTSYVCDNSRRTKTGQPIKRYLHRGLIIENLAQSIARDVLAWQMANCDAELQKAGIGWVAGSVHDENLGINTNPELAEKIMSACMSVGPAWADGLPLENEGGSALEYSK